MPNYLRASLADAQAAGKAQPGSPISFIASTPGIKRDGKDLDQDDWHLDNFRANPVVLWAHDYRGARLPLGRGTVYMQGGNLWVDIIFDQTDSFAVAVENKYRNGFLHAVSVGWNSIEVEGEQRYDLLDVSAVPLPGDPEALMQRQIAGLRGLYDDLGGVLGIEEQAESEEAEDQEPPMVIHSVDLDYEVLAGTIVNLLTEEYEKEPEPAGSRAGAVLSARNKDDLKDAMRLIQSVIERASKAMPEDEEEVEEERSVSVSDKDLQAYLGPAAYQLVIEHRQAEAASEEETEQADDPETRAAADDEDEEGLVYLLDIQNSLNSLKI